MKKSKRRIIGLGLSLTLFAGLILTSQSFDSVSKKIHEDDGGVFICENGEQGPLFYPASYSTESSDEPYYSTQNTYTFSTMNFKNLHRRVRGDSVKVAVIDSGLNYTHEDFIDTNNEQIIKGHSRTIDNKSGSWLYYQFDAGHQTRIDDTLGHGTNVASVIASQINAIGCAGIAPEVDLYVYKVTNTSNGYEWTAINSALQYCIDEGIDVINMSFQAYENEVSYGSSTMPASTGCSSVMTTMLNNCYNAGITLVAAAGNFNTNEPSYPASNNHVISVGSLAESSLNTKAGYSNTYGIDLVAPGTVYVADKGSTNAYKKTPGTSFSAPIVTAAIALYKQLNPSATPDEIESALLGSCDTISGTPSWAGHGRLNLARFLGIDIATSLTINNPEIVNGELALEVGDTFDINCTINGEGSFSNGVTFESDDDDIATVDENGHIIATGAGEALILVESIDNPELSEYITITVTVPTTLVVSPEDTTLDVGDTCQLQVETSPSQSVTYSSSNTTVATVSSSGLITAKKAGSATITISANGLERTCTVTVNNVLVTSITITGSNSVNVGSYVNLSATVLPSNATNKNVTWSSDDASVATVNSSGRVTGVVQGSTKIRATANDGSGIYDEFTISVNNVLATSVSLNATSRSMTIGDTFTFIATVSPNNATIKTLSWTSDNPSVATVNSSGVVTAVAEGTAIITVATTDGSNKSATCAITVNKPSNYTLVTSNSMLSNNDLVVIKTEGGDGVTGWNNNKDATISSTEANWRQFVVGSASNSGFTLRDTSVNEYIASPTDNEFKYNTTAGAISVDSDGHLICNSRYLCANGTSYRFYKSVGSYVPFFVYKVTKDVKSITIKTAPTNLTYEEGDSFDPTGLVITVTYDDNSTSDVAYANESANFGFNPSTSTALTTSNTSVSITYGGKSVNQSITVTVPKTLSSISVSGQTTSFVLGDTFTFGGTVTATFNTGNESVTATSITGYDMTTTGEQTVTVSYTFKGVTKTATYGITVNPGTLSSISVSEQTTSYQKNAEFSFDGTCTATMANGYQMVVTPTSVTSPNMSIGGQKAITVSYTYNGTTKTTTYNINVISDRTVMETTYTQGYVEIGRITFTTSVVNSNTTELSTSTGGYANTESNAIRLGSSGDTGSITVTTDSSIITKVVVSAKSYGSDSSVNLQIGGTNNTITSSYADYTKTYGTATNSVTVQTTANKKRAYVQSIILYKTGQVATQTDISSTADCLGLETFIDTYLHFGDYQDSLGYCKDSEHHYYSDAKTAFNNLNLHQRTLFSSNSAYTPEWNRLSSWASFNGESLDSNTLLAASRINSTSVVITDNNSLFIGIVIISLSTLAIGGYFFLKRREEQ